MTKKSRKPNLPQETLNRARRELYGTASEAPASAKPSQTQTIEYPPQPKPVVQRRTVLTSEAELRREYAYVITDLRNMAMLAAVLMVVLVAMSLLI